MKCHLEFGLVILIALAAANRMTGAEPKAASGAQNPSTQTTLFISEFLARNSKGLRDEDGDSSDWIEIYNAGSMTQDLRGWHLTDSRRHPTKWSFPSTNLAAKAYLIVFASGKDRSVAGRLLHTNFKLGAKGGALTLVDPSRDVVDGYTDYPPQEANVSFGHSQDRGGQRDEAGWRYFLRPTPRAPQAPGGKVLGAVIRAVSEPPVHPAPGTAIKVTASIAGTKEQLSEITLHYRVMFDPEREIPMAQEGTPDSRTDRFLVFSASIPASCAAPSKMIRWYVTATVAGVQSRWPLNAGVLHLPRYLGTVIERPDLATALPVYDFFVEGYRFPRPDSEQTGIDTDQGGRGTLYAFDRFYDNIFLRIKGTTSRHLLKRSHRIDFNPGHEFHWDASHSPVRKVSLNTEYPDPSYARQYLSCWLQREAGTGAAPDFPVRAQMNGQFWQLAFHTLPVGDELLKEMGLDPRGALYKNVEQIVPGKGRAAKKTRKREDQSDYQAFVNAISERQPLAKRRVALFERTDLPTVINYIAVARIAHEADDVWANMVLYRDSNGTGEWRPVPFDLNLSFGQLFYDGDQWNTIINATNDLNKSHPLYGSSATRTHYPANRYHPDGTYFNMFYNRLYDAVIRVPETRSMLLRRTRTLMDQFLQPPGTPTNQLRIEKELDALAAKIMPEAELDRKIWGWPPVNPFFGVYGLGADYGPVRGIADIKNLYLAPRRVHFYSTHSITNTAKPIGIRNSDNAGIPLPQPAHPSIQFGAMEMTAATAALNQDFVQLLNTNSFAVDLSGWSLEGALTHRFKPGTVIAPGQSLYLSSKVTAFRARANSPKAGDGCFVQGDYQRHAASPTPQSLLLRDETDTVIATSELAPSVDASHPSH